MARPKGWPVQYQEDYQQFVIEFQAIKSITDKILRQGNESTAYMRRSFPLLRELGERIKLHVASLETRKRKIKRWPYRSNDLIVEIDLAAGLIINLATRGDDFYSDCNGPAATVKISSIHKTALEALTALAGNAVSFEPEPDAEQQAEELVKKLTKDW